MFAAQTLPSLVTALFYEKRPAGYVAGRSASGLLQTVGLAVLSRDMTCADVIACIGRIRNSQELGVLDCFGWILEIVNVDDHC